MAAPDATRVFQGALHMAMMVLATLMLVIGGLGRGLLSIYYQMERQRRRRALMEAEMLYRRLRRSRHFRRAYPLVL